MTANFRPHAWEQAESTSCSDVGATILVVGRDEKKVQRKNLRPVDLPI